MGYTKNQAGYDVSPPLYNGANEPIEEDDGAPTTAIMGDGGAFTAHTNTATYCDGGVWHVLATTAEKNYDKRIVRWRHPLLLADVFTIDEAYQTAATGYVSSQAVVNDNVYFFTITHSDTGADVDADAAPTFAVYEEATVTPIVTGTMVKITGKTGHYVGTFAITTSNGFEEGKWYNVVVTAIVAGVTGSEPRLTFRVCGGTTGDEIADAVLLRNFSYVEATAPEHCLATVGLGTLQSSIVAGNWIIYRTNGVTVHATKPVTVDATSKPITGVS